MILSDVKQYLKIDDDIEDTLLEGLVIAANSFLLKAGVKTRKKDELYNLCIKLLVGHWYENREVVGKANKLAYSLDSIIIQLKYSEEE